MEIQVAHNLCNGCSLCVNTCPQSIYELKEGKSRAIHPENCLECHLCEMICPNEAITLKITLES